MPAVSEIDVLVRSLIVGPMNQSCLQYIIKQRLSEILRLSADNMNLLEKYDNYILKNAAQISSIESALRTITYILPSMILLSLD